MDNLFIGTKRVLATAMSLGDYNAKRGWQLPEDEDGSTRGYMVEYLDGGKANTEFSKYYVSWSPKDVFEKSYRHTKITVDFGTALKALESGSRVCRKGWNGKGMFLFLLPGGTVPIKAIHDENLRAVIEAEIQKDEFEALPTIRMFTADKKILTGWLASQSDMFAKDWVILK